MNKLEKLIVFLKKYLPMFFMLCLSYNPIIRYRGLSKAILVGYTVLLIIYTLFIIDVKTLKKIWGILTGLLVLIFTIVFFQQIILGFVTYPGVFSYIATMLLSLTTILFYKYHKIDFIESYIKTLAFLAAVSIPFWILNQFGFYGIILGEGTKIKSMILYTSYGFIPKSNVMFRNSGMFWEPGAFAGYLILALVFIALKNRKFQIGPYTKEVVIISFGLLTTQSTTGYLIFIFILLIHSLQTYSLGKIIILPLLVLLLSLAYLNLNFMQEKIQSQLTDTAAMDENDINAGRFGALKMDLQYIKSSPIIGNGWDVKTRYRFHPQVKEDTKIGHGNGMSNIMAIWGIPFFLFWLFCVYRFVFQVSKSSFTGWSSLFIIILLLQGEQFLYYPMFLSFFFLPFVYQNSLNLKNKIYLIKSFIRPIK